MALTIKAVGTHPDITSANRQTVVVSGNFAPGVDGSGAPYLDGYGVTTTEADGYGMGWTVRRVQQGRFELTLEGSWTALLGAAFTVAASSNTHLSCHLRKGAAARSLVSNNTLTLSLVNYLDVETDLTNEEDRIYFVLTLVPGG